MTTIELTRVSEPWWDDKPVIVVGAGPSLAGFDFNQLRGLGYILAVKGSIPDLPFADAAFGLDLPWMIREKAALEEVAKQMPLYLAIDKGERPLKEQVAGATYILRQRRPALSESRDLVHIGGTSGYGGLNLAFIKKIAGGERRPQDPYIFLFGFDYTQDHYCPDRYRHQKRDHNKQLFPNWALNYEETLPQLKEWGIAVVNASPVSKIPSFERTTPDEAVKRLRRLRSERDHSVRGDDTVDP